MRWSAATKQSERERARDSDERVIRPTAESVTTQLVAVWRHRELLMFLTWRDILVRYKQTAIGFAWVLVQPLLAVLIFSVLFGRIAKLDSGGVPYPLLTLTGVLAWQFFSNAVTATSNSLVANAAVVTKVYFPRILVPVSAGLATVCDVFVSCLILVGALIYYGYDATVALAYLPVVMLVLFVLALGIGLGLSALNVRYRDVRYALPFLLQLGLYISPVGFGTWIVPERLRLLYSMNPMVGVIDGFRWAVMGDRAAMFWPAAGFSAAFGVAALASGLAYFRKVERILADVI